MATKTAQIIIEVDDKSLQELNDEIKALELSVSKLKSGTQEWNKQNQKLGQLKTQFNNATKEATKLQNVIEKVSSADQLRAFAKLGQGMVGTFAAVNGAVTLLGGNSKAFDEITAKAASFLQIMGGLNAISETFSKENLKGLSAIGNGFKGLVGTVKAASTGMKAALISTGIGALVVGVGLLIANFDKLKGLFKNQAKEQAEANKKNYDAAQSLTKQSEINYQARLKEIEVKKENYALIQKEYDAINAGANERNRTEIDNQDLANAALTLAQDRLAEEIALNKVLSDEWANAKKKDADAAYAKVEISDATLILLENELALAEVRDRQANLLYMISLQLDENRKIVEKNENALIKLNVQADKSLETYTANRNILAAQIDTLVRMGDVLGGLNEEDEKRLKTLKVQLQALDIQEKARKKQLAEETKQLEQDIKINRLIQDNVIKYRELTNEAIEQANAVERGTESFADYTKYMESSLKKYQEYAKTKLEIANFDKKGLEMFHQQNKQFEVFLKHNQKYVEKAKDGLAVLLSGKKVNEEVLNKNAELLSLQIRINDARTSELEKTIEVQTANRKVLEVKKDELEATNKIIEQQKLFAEGKLKEVEKQLEGNINEEQRKTLLEKQVALESEVNGYVIQISDNNNEILNTKDEIVKTNDEILASEKEINVVVKDTEQKTKETADNVERQSLTFAQLQELVGEYGEEIVVVWQNIMAGFSLVAAIYDRKAANAQENIDKLNKQLEDIADAEAEHQDKLLGYQEELKDANGERYDELMAAIELESQAKSDAAAEESAINAQLAEEEKKKLAAEAKAAKWRKAQALIDATIAGALAVIKSLPNVFLAVGTGILTAAQIAIIAAQKTEAIPEGFEDGGFTKKSSSNSDVAGVVHANEYVVPAHLVERNAGIINSIESQRLRGLESGGLVTPALGGAGQDMIDYERLGSIIMNGFMSVPAPVVSVQKITSAQNDVTVTKQLAGLTR